MAEARFPDFYIVGAPKCGTTALTFYLMQHPQIYMGRKDDSLDVKAVAMLDNSSLDVSVKDFTELGYFGSDMLAKPTEKQSKEAYLAYFAGARAGQILGETTALNLKSKSAAREIHDANPEARVIALLRDPVDLLTSMQNQRRYMGYRHAYGSLEELIAADRQAEDGSPRPENEQYVDVCMFSEQLKRYFRIFDRDRVLVLFQEEMRRDTTDTFREICRFLGVDPDVDVNFAAVNRYKKITWVQRTWSAIRASGLIRLKLLLPPQRRRDLRRWVYRLMLSHDNKPSPDEAVQARLRDLFRDEIESLEQLLGRPLPWPGYRSAGDVFTPPP
ncbi:MAG: sulfotransferase, partial [Rhodospirillales bacterium]|nr:sulfotransferase [Rhodospirillales bacterium]